MFFQLLCDEDGDSPCRSLKTVLTALGGLLFLLLLSTLSCLEGLDPNEYGILQNSLTGSLLEDGRAYRGGLHYVGFFKKFLLFPATYQLVEFSNHTAADRRPVRTRTGADPSDPDSGGQPIDISASFEFVLNRENLKDIYTSFGGYEAARDRWLLLSYNQISNIAQRFTPQDFWTKRHLIAERMRAGVNETLSELGYVSVPLFQILRVDFDQKFEDTITQIQVAEQQKVVNEYQQKVVEVEQKLFTLVAENDALITNITAGGAAEAAKIVAHARQQAFIMVQDEKAKSLDMLRATLAWRQNATYLERYLDLKGISDSARDESRSRPGGTGNTDKVKDAVRGRSTSPGSKILVNLPSPVVNF
ncbi:unnamed protein product [Amoebophrya sp. A120]|nr:unnamed protein product [Amoebophrya sp. A120]|eukprot:GSA120T00005973001.1